MFCLTNSPVYNEIQFIWIPYLYYYVEAYMYAKSLLLNVQYFTWFLTCVTQPSSRQSTLPGRLSVLVGGWYTGQSRGSGSVSTPFVTASYSLCVYKIYIMLSTSYVKRDIVLLHVV